MAILVIPIKRGAAAWTQRQTLDGVAYVLEFAWNGREANWYLNISDVNGVPLFLSRKLVTNRPLLNRSRYVVGLPPGEMVAFDASATVPYAGFDELGSAVKLLYFEKVELA